MFVFFVIFVGLLAALLVPFVLGYNRLVRLRNSAQTASADVEVQLQRRHDLVPNLANTVGGYAG
ncbi:MAG TPA: LemA family protein, partial [Gaiellaceae bacterium]|nr:LemA family protein [Gaiellaceae bacterium]